MQFSAYFAELRENVIVLYGGGRQLPAERNDCSRLQDLSKKALMEVSTFDTDLLDFIKNELLECLGKVANRTQS